MPGAARPPLSSPAEEAPCQGTALGKPLLPTWFCLRGRGTSSQRRALEPRPREQRGGQGPPPPPPPPAAARVRPTPLAGGDPGPCRGRSGNVFPAVWGRVNVPPAPRQQPRAPGRSPFARAEGRAAPAPPAGRPVRGLRADFDRPGAPELWQPRGSRQRGDILSGAAAYALASLRSPPLPLRLSSRSEV